MAQVKVTLTRSLIGYPKDQRATVKALGLTKIRSSVVKEDSPTLRGMLHKVAHMVKVEDVKEVCKCICMNWLPLPVPRKLASA